jgi:hypothetical protein
VRIWLCAFDCAGLVHPSVRAPLKFDLFFFSHSENKFCESSDLLVSNEEFEAAKFLSLQDNGAAK